MTAKRLPRPRDPVQLGKLIGDILTGQVEDRAPDHAQSGKDQAALTLGRNGGLHGGKARPAQFRAHPSNLEGYSRNGRWRHFEALENGRHGELLEDGEAVN